MTVMVHAFGYAVRRDIPRRFPNTPGTFLLATAIRLFYLELFLLATVGLFG